STGTPPSYAFDDTRLHSAIFAQFMVRKALTGPSTSFRGAAKRGEPGISQESDGDSGFDANASPRNDAYRSVAPHLHAHYRAMPVDPRAPRDEVAAVHAPSDPSRDSPLFTPDSGQAWVRLALALLIGSIGSVGMWSVVVVLPVVQ